MKIYPLKIITFDLIISSLSPHLVTNPDKMLVEFKRVLKEDGYAYYSIWGRPENCDIFTVIPKTLKKHYIPLPEIRSNFHLFSEEILKNLIFKAGINEFKISTTFIPFDFTEGKEFYFMINAPSFSEMMACCSEDKKDLIKNEIINEYDKYIKTNKFFGIEAFIIKTGKF